MLLLWHWQKHRYMEQPVQRWKLQSELKRRPEWKNMRNSYKPHSGVHYLKYDLCETHTIQRVELRFILYHCFSKREKCTRLLQHFIAQMGFFNCKNICLAHQTIYCSSPELIQKSKKFFKPISLTLKQIPPKGSIFHQYYYSDFL